MIQVSKDVQVYSEGVTDDLTTTDPSLPKTVRWGLWDVALGFVVFFVILAFASILASSGPLRETLGANADAFSLVASLLAYGGLVVVIVVASRRSGFGTLAADFGLSFKPIDLVIGLGIGLAGRVFTLLLTAVAIAITGYSPERGNLVLSPDPLWIVLNGVLIAVIVAPIVEELFFRGLVLRAIRNRFLRKDPTDVTIQRRAAIAAILISSAAFMLLHLYQASDWTLFIILAGSTFAVGFLNAVVAVRTGRLGGPIIGHMVFNGSAVLLAVVLGS